MDKTLREFQLFLKASEAPPRGISEKVFAQVHGDLNPSSLKVFSKLGFIQIALGLLTLVFCPQLGVGPLIGEHGIMMFFMHYGPVVCAGVCGVIYFGFSILLASLAMRPEELRSIRNKHLVGLPILGAVSLVLLMLLGASESLLIYAVWFVGAVTGGELGSQLVIRMRLKKIAA